MKRDTVPVFPGRLKELREAKGLTRDQLAVAAGVSSHTVAKLEQGTRSPTLAAAWKIAQALGCSLDAMVGSSKPARKKSP